MFKIKAAKHPECLRIIDGSGNEGSVWWWRTYIILSPCTYRPEYDFLIVPAPNGTPVAHNDSWKGDPIYITTLEEFRATIQEWLDLGAPGISFQNPKLLRRAVQERKSQEKANKFIAGLNRGILPADMLRIQAAVAAKLNSKLLLG